jgi:hypothetical protein
MQEFHYGTGYGPLADRANREFRYLLIGGYVSDRIVLEKALKVMRDRSR